MAVSCDLRACPTQESLGACAFLAMGAPSCLLRKENSKVLFSCLFLSNTKKMGSVNTPGNLRGYAVLWSRQHWGCLAAHLSPLGGPGPQVHPSVCASMLRRHCSGCKYQEHTPRPRAHEHSWALRLPPTRGPFGGMAAGAATLGCEGDSLWRWSGQWGDAAPRGLLSEAGAPPTPPQPVVTCRNLEWVFALDWGREDLLAADFPGASCGIHLLLFEEMEARRPG